jgi:hypothetical protein
LTRIAIIVAQIIARTVASTLTRVQVLARVAFVTIAGFAAFTGFTVMMFTAMTSTS